MISKPDIHSSKNDLIEFVHGWVKLCSKGYINEAFQLLDKPIDTSRHTWTPDDFHEVKFNHFDDDKYPVVTDPDTVEGKVRKDVFEYNDGSGWGVEYDLPLNNVVSDFTLLFDFIKSNDELKIILDDCHVM